MYYQLRTKDGGVHDFSRGILVDQQGNVQNLLRSQVSLEPLRYWHAADGTSYPVDWRLRVDNLAIDIEVRAALDDQLMDHTVHYWEGAVDVSGSHRGRGYLELSGYAGNPG
jgi:predicted secreted hydrolase